MIHQTDGTVQAVVPNGETWTSGNIRLAADGRLGVVANGPAIVGDGVKTATLHCAVDVEVEMETTVGIAAGAGGAAIDVATQTIVAAGGGTKDVRLVLYPAAAGAKASVVLN